MILPRRVQLTSYRLRDSTIAILNCPSHPGSWWEWWSDHQYWLPPISNHQGKKHWTKVLVRKKLPQQVEERLLQRISHKNYHQHFSQPKFMFKGVQQSHHMSMCQLSILTPHPAKMSAVKSMSKSLKMKGFKPKVYDLVFLFFGVS